MLAHGLSTILPIEETVVGPVYWLRQASGFGMTLFFVLSGFVIHYNYRGVGRGAGLKGLGAFLWARFARLYPLFIVMLAVNIVLSGRFQRFLAGESDGFAGLLSALPYFLLFTQSWFYMLIDGTPLVSAIGGGSPLTWSISTEWFFYLAYPAIALLLLPKRKPLTIALIVVVWCGLWIALASSLYEASGAMTDWASARWPLLGTPEQNQQDFIRALAALYVALCSYRRIRPRMPGSGALPAALPPFRFRRRAYNWICASGLGFAECACDHVFDL